MRRIASRYLVPVVVVAAVVAGSCNGAQEGAPGPSASPETAAAPGDAPRVAPAPAEAIGGVAPGIEVCAELPPEVLGPALGVQATGEARALEDDPDPNCSYRFEGAGGSIRVDVYLRSGADYDWALQTARNFDREVIEVAGIGEEAYRKTTLDGWWEVWVRLSDGSAVQTTAREVELAEGAADTALREIF